MEISQAIKEVRRLQASVMDGHAAKGCGLSIYARDGEYSVTAHKSGADGAPRWCNVVFSRRTRQKYLQGKINRLRSFVLA